MLVGDIHGARRCVVVHWRSGAGLIGGLSGAYRAADRGRGAIVDGGDGEGDGRKRYKTV